MDYRSRYVGSDQFLAIDGRRGRGPATYRNPSLTYAILRDINLSEREVPHGNIVWTQGDRIDYLAQIHLGSVHLWYRIMDMNPHVSDPNHIAPGTLLRVPRLGV